ncbi:uncharacterized protein E5676_scaffold184G00420 [Cucumis melo var. makuwa]|uniref:Uncharacterized protein n=1 Tax=Cucumis melo var. makuwa TaxID=1194695 RepID=A0A5A7UXG6_CUCMM|nr:uncharacterized protein E6C27_scaffold108G001230 [Cucumis melo var. makuwa]TYK24795.1 uncharacterized protein E5676_scaffold184G00420 [Cucumis melo var. makuwa]
MFEICGVIVINLVVFIKIHEVAARERKTNDLGAVWILLNRPAQKDRSTALKFRNVGSAMDGLNDFGPILNGPGVDGVADEIRGSPLDGRKEDVQCLYGPQIKSEVLINPGGEEPNNISSGCISKNQSANVKNFVENDLNKQSTDPKSTWIPSLYSAQSYWG